MRKKSTRRKPNSKPDTSLLDYVEDPRVPEDFVDFWTRALRSTIGFLQKAGVRSLAEVRTYQAQRLIHEALWKVPARDGKYHTRYYSAGVYERCIREGSLPQKGRPHWPRSGRRGPECVFEHVVERTRLVEWLLVDPKRCEKIEQVAIACVVTPTEDKKLEPDAAFDPARSDLREFLWTRYVGKVDVYDRKEKCWVIKHGCLQRWK